MTSTLTAVMRVCARACVCVARAPRVRTAPSRATTWKADEGRGEGTPPDGDGAAQSARARSASAAEGTAVHGTQGGWPSTISAFTWDTLRVEDLGKVLRGDGPRQVADVQVGATRRLRVVIFPRRRRFPVPARGARASVQAHVDCPAVDLNTVAALRAGFASRGSAHGRAHHPPFISRLRRLAGRKLSWCATRGIGWHGHERRRGARARAAAFARVNG